MSSNSHPIPDEIFYDFVTRPQSIEQLFSSLYERSDPTTRQHFMATNSHLGAQVRPGQMVIITPPNAQQCSAYEADLSAAAQLVDKQLAEQTAEEAKIMAENYALLANIANYTGAGYGVAVNYFKQHKMQVKNILQKIETLHVNTYNKRGNFSNREFFQRRKMLFQQLDNTLKTMVGRNRMGLDLNRNNLKRSLGLSTKSLSHQLKDYPAPISDLPGFERNHAKVRQYGKVLKGAGYLALAIDGTQSVAKIKEACTVGREDECTKSKFSESGRLTGSIIGGGLGGLLGYGMCSVVFSAPSAGTSLLWCGVVLGGVGGVAGGMFTSKGAQFGGEVIYEKIYNK